jgi:hypothetical protein
LISVSSKYSGGETQNWLKPIIGKRLLTNMSWSGRGWAAGRRITAFKTEKIAVLAPIPTASVKMVRMAKPGERRRFRRADLRSWTNESGRIDDSLDGIADAVVADSKKESGGPRPAATIDGPG